MIRGMRYCRYNPLVLCDLKHIRDIPYCLNCAIAKGYIVNAHQQLILKLLPATQIDITTLKECVDGWR